MLLLLLRTSTSGIRRALWFVDTRRAEPTKSIRMTVYFLVKFFSLDRLTMIFVANSIFFRQFTVSMNTSISFVLNFENNGILVNSLNGLKEVVFSVWPRAKSKRIDINNNYYLRIVRNLCYVICFYIMPRQRRTTLKEKIAEHFKAVEADDPNNYDRICQIEK